MLQVDSPNAADGYRTVNRQSEAVLIDVMSEQNLVSAGRLMWCVDRQPFVVGSSGVEYALIGYWREAGLLSEAPQAPQTRGTDRIVVLSGSCSPVTAGQIEYAVRNGFARFVWM